MMRRFVCCVLAMGMLASPVYAQTPQTQVDALIEKLIDKGVLSNEEADNLRGQIAYDAKTLSDSSLKTGVPEWVQNMKISGDFRARVQQERREGNSGERMRGRIRTRLNVDTKVNDKARVVVGIATDGGGNSSNPNNSRSGNLTYSSYNGSSANPFSKSYVVLNKAYGQYMFTPQFTVTAGKMDNPLWEPMEFLWDGDITPEGAAVQYNRKINDTLSLFSTGSFFMLNELSGSTSDPFMYVGQAGLTFKPSEKMDAKGAFMYTGYGNIKSGFTGPSGGSSSGSNNTLNTAFGTNALKYDYSAPLGAVEVGFNDPFEALEGILPVYIPRLGFFGEYTQNPNTKELNHAWMAGAYLGNSKVGGWGTWKITGAYKSLERDAWLDMFPDSDFYSGNTGVKGVEAIMEIGLAKNMSLAFDYYQTRRIDAHSRAEHLVQYDINWKF